MRARLPAAPTSIRRPVPSRTSYAHGRTGGMRNKTSSATVKKSSERPSSETTESPGWELGWRRVRR